MTSEIWIPKCCPLGCGDTIVFQQLSEAAITFFKKTEKDAANIHWENSFGILCKKCGYGTTLLPTYKKDLTKSKI